MPGKPPGPGLRPTRRILGSRRKRGNAHVVPHPPRCPAILREVGGSDRSTPPTRLLFPAGNGRPLSDVAF